ncbi:MULTISPECIES: hypothetical protein [unclassified Rhizobium]|jgi:hypothetical protein|uniref:hypothetical protein n=1 Tax=unclassified Rhizobium TaxID=2613769 RepID=UPI0006477762|nr:MULTISPECIES: hypothetical protein [unclassified Rhizobium]OJY63882.1 MAG: hypothetical protein BGP09_01320 [Rhizobium sp. 60-20]RKD60876.1 hypothetical protein BJ928_108163 [Rhizobium sp. WW_1]
MVESIAAQMNAERFEALTAAYGGDIARWPQAERAAAREFAKSPAAAEALAHAADLDALLDTYVVKPGGAGLEGRIVAKLVRRLTIRNWFRFGSAGIGLVGVGIAGALAGSIAIAILAPSLTSDTSVVSDGTATMFGDIGPDAGVAQQDSQ